MWVAFVIQFKTNTKNMWLILPGFQNNLIAENFNKREHNVIESYVKCLYYEGGFGSQDMCSELQVIDSQEYAFDTYELLND